MKNNSTKLIYIFYSLCLVILFAQCKKDTLTDNEDTAQTGFLTISPRIDITLLKSAQAVNTDSFKIEIYSSTDVLVQEIENFNDLNVPIELPVGVYYVIIHSNNLVPAAFNNPYYEGRSENFQIIKTTTTNVEVVAELSNVKVTVQYAAQTQADFIGFKTVVSTGTDSLTYLEQDTTAGYFIVTPLSVRAQLLYTAVGGSTDTLVIFGEIPNPQPKDHIVITVLASLNGGGINGITLTVDESTNPVNITIQDTTFSGTFSGILIDPRDLQEYTTVQIGNQVWMAENLNFLPDALNFPSDGSQTIPFYYQIDPAKGILYNWPAAMNNTNFEGSQGVCPSGWHLPTLADWNELANFIQLDNSTPPDVGTALKTTNGWNGTDDYGFTALPGGLRNPEGGFSELNTRGFWWTSSEAGSSFANYRMLENNVNLISNSMNKSAGLSVRCIQD